MDRTKKYYRYLRGTFLSVLVNRRLFSTEAFSRERVELKGMRILAGVRSNFSENRERS